MSSRSPVKAGVNVTELALLFSCCLFSVGASAASISESAKGGTQGDLNNGIDKRHRDALGNLCLQIAPIARPQAVNSNIYDQVLVIRNECNRSIKIRACYSNSDHCVESEIPALARRDTIIGVSPIIKFFRYELREL
jgi:hypothetical protein